jgi:hypothetical protein
MNHQQQKKIAHNLKKIKEKISQTNNSKKTTIVAVTKTRSSEEVSEIISLGIKSIGENRIQEAENKFPKVLNIHLVEKRLIGTLQTNKVKKAINLFDTIDSVGSYRLAEKISKTASILSKKQRILIQINTSGEKTKGGFKPEDKNEIVKCFNLPNIKIEGLMTIGPPTNKKEETKKAFTLLNTMFLDINKNILPTQKMKTLSMGMSGDFLLGVSCGSTMVRVGTGIFGERSYVA